MDLIYIEGEFRKRNDNSYEIIDGWKWQGKRERIGTAVKTKKYFEGLNQFFFRFFLVEGLRALTVMAKMMF